MIAPAARALRTALPVLLVLVLAAVVVPATAPPSPFGSPAAGGAASAELLAYLPRSLRQEQITTVPSGEVWQSSQVLQPALAAFAELPGNTAYALGYDDRLDAPELQGRWLLVDLVPPGGDGSVQTLAFHVGPTQITLQALLTPRSWTVYVPGMPVLDPSRSAGVTATWSGLVKRSTDGKDPTATPAKATISAAPAVEPDCLNTTIDLRATTGSDTSTRVSRWCRGAQAGWAADLVDGRGVARTTAATAAHAIPDLAAAPAPPVAPTGRVTAVDGYRLVANALSRTDQDSPRQATTAGSVLVTARSDGRIEGWSPVQQPLAGHVEDYLRWRALPAGRATALTAVGEVAVAADTANRVTAWAPDGWRLWQQPTDDLVTSLTPADRAVVVAEAGGRLRLLDAATGAERWSRDFGASLTISTGDDSVAVVADGTLSVLDARTGSTRWQAALGGDGLLATLDDLVVVKLRGWLVARSATDGTVAWWRSVEGPSVSLTATTSQVVLVAASSTIAVGTDGHLDWSTGPALAVGRIGDAAVLILPDRVELWGPAGRRRAWDYPAGYSAPQDPFAVTARGIRLFQPSNQGGRWWDYR